ncbi:MAG: calcium:proton antiporter [Proteobacteria bacterium]|nr:MAG: calcium:proton antiporter [Pseudomonadota bacterium]
MTVKKPLSLNAIATLLISWATVICFLIFGSDWLTGLSLNLTTGLLFLWLFSVIMYTAFGVVHEAEDVAELLGEPLGTLVLTLSIVIIEVALVSAVMLGAKEAPTLGRDTMFAVLMIVLNGVVGLGLLIGGIRHKEQSYNLQGAAAYLAVLIPLTSIALILPNFTKSTDNGTLSPLQATAFSIFTIALYAIFILIQTGRHRGFFIHPDEAKKLKEDKKNKVKSVKKKPRPDMATVLKHLALLLLNILPIVLLSKNLAKILDFGISALELPPALGGIIIAAIVFTPEGISALRAVIRDDLQRALNLCLGAATSTVGLTVPAVLAISLFTGQTVILGLAPTEMTLLAVTLLLCTLTFSNLRTTLLEGAVHLVMFFVYIVLVFSP